MPIKSSHITIDGLPALHVVCDHCSTELDVHTPNVNNLRRYAAERGWHTEPVTGGLMVVTCPACQLRLPFPPKD